MLLWQLNLQNTEQVRVSWLEAVPGGSASYSLTTTPGSYTITGVNANLVSARLLETTPGSYAITGSAASINSSRLLEVTPGSYSITGSSANLIYTTASSFLLETVAGSYTITGANANLRYNSILVVQPGSYSITGADANLFVETPNKILETEVGSYVINGFSANFIYSGEAQILKPGGKGLSVWQQRQNRLEALKNELWYLYQDENDEEIKEAILDVVQNNDNLDELLTLLKQQLSIVKQLYDKAQQEQYQKAFEAAQEIQAVKAKQKKQRNEEAAVMLLF